MGTVNDLWSTSTCSTSYPVCLLYVYVYEQDYSKAQKEGKKVETPSFEKAQEEIAENSGMAALLGGAGGKSKGKSHSVL